MSADNGTTGSRKWNEWAERLIYMVSRHDREIEACCNDRKELRKMINELRIKIYGMASIIALITALLGGFIGTVIAKKLFP